VLRTGLFRIDFGWEDTMNKRQYRATHEPNQAVKKPEDSKHFSILETITYIDRLAFYVKVPLPRDLKRQLKNNAGKVDVKHRNPKMSLGVQRVDIKQLNARCLELLNEHFSENESGVDFVINCVEFALDFVTDNNDACESYLQSHTVQPWRKNQSVFVYKNITTYFCGRNAPNNMVLYSDKPSKMKPDSGPCVHIEYRLRTFRVLRRLGILTFRDLIDFDHRQFWRERLQFRVVDEEKLGRGFLNQGLKRQRRTAWIKKGCNMDIRAGHALARAAHKDSTVNRFPVICSQLVKDEYGPLADRAWTKQDNSTFLPLD
jgi:hypothetical protein